MEKQEEQKLFIRG